jgi:hypothetical protein
LQGLLCGVAALDHRFNARTGAVPCECYEQAVALRDELGEKNNRSLKLMNESLSTALKTAHVAQRSVWQLVAKKSRSRAGTIDNHGGFMLIEPFNNRVVCGYRFDLTPEEVIAECKQEDAA